MGTVNLSKQTVNLTKSQVINLSKSTDEGLKNIMIGLGWDEKKAKVTKKAGFFAKLFGASDVVEKSGYEYDLDAWICMMKDGKAMQGTESLLYFGNKDLKKGKKHYAHHHGDNLTGAGDGDDEQIDIMLDEIPEEYNGIVIGVTIYSAKARKQSFGDIENFFVRVVDSRDDFEICRYSDSVAEDYKDCYTFIVGKLYKDKGEWQFKSAGYGTHDGDISSAVKHYNG